MKFRCHLRYWCYPRSTQSCIFRWVRCWSCCPTLAPYPFCIPHFPLVCFLCFYKFFSTCHKFLQMRCFSPWGIFQNHPLELAQFALDTSFLTASPLSSQFEDWSNVRRSRPAFYSHVPLSAMLVFTIGTFLFSAGNSSSNAALLCEITLSTTGACFEVTHSALLTTCLEILLCWKGTEFPMVELILLFSLLLAMATGIPFSLSSLLPNFWFTTWGFCFFTVTCPFLSDWPTLTT